ncbi:MAG: 6-phosphofructokinase, partial [Deltaproteobacteria bacterium]|nr:6-phosphofructokinase [Deltaproteobacteria bacterium]
QRIKVIGIPGTIDNDVSFTDATIGYDTAVNTALDAIDRIRDTAAAHERFFIIEVMGRNSGHIAIEVGLTSGAEAILIPEIKKDTQLIAQKLERGKARGKTSSILIAAEGKKAGEVYGLARELGKKLGVELRVVVLGHIQRGGSPTSRDRLLATRMGAAAAKAAFEGRSGIMIRARRAHRRGLARRGHPDQEEVQSRPLRARRRPLAVAPEQERHPDIGPSR